MMPHGLTDSVAGVSESPVKCRHCGATTRLGNGLCLSCTLREGLEGDSESSRESFEAILAEDEVHDTHWRVGNYEILEEIGRGGMGVIYRARQRHSRRIVALKRIVSYHADSRETLERFRREAEAAASLDHPNILPIYEVGQGEDALPFFSMKYAPGGSLQKAEPALRGEPRECVRLMAKVARAVEYAHEHGVLHRDLKPGNILLDGRGEPFVTDFGLAKWLDTTTDLTRTLAIFGTPGYIAPEQAKGPAAKLTPAADVYSLGAILFDLFTGRPPFLGEHALAVIQQASEKPAPKLRSLVPLLDRSLETICARCLEREPRARYRSAGDLAIDLERWLEGRPIIARRISPPVRAWRWAKRNPKLAAATAAAFGSAMAAAFLFFSRNGLPPQSSLGSRLRPISAIPEKSVAVLPFENRSRDPENVFFADGVQDEILTDLARIADLKVISRTSVMQYKTGAKRNLRQIANELGVAHVMEGSVQRAGNRVRVNAQLIDARTDAHLWAQTYDRDLADVFAIQSEIAKAIADQLQAKLSPNEKSEIEQPPTTDVIAFDFYSHAKTLFLNAFGSSTGKADLLQAADLLNQAVARDPSFFQAYCQLAFTQVSIYFLDFDHTPSRLAAAETAVQMAARLQPDAGETHLARARNLYWGYSDYDGALAELEIARQRLPGDSWVVSLKGYIERREGRWEESLRDLERAIALDPRNILTLQQAARSYSLLHRYVESKSLLARVLSFEPNDPVTKVLHAFVELDSNGNARPVHEVIDSIRRTNPEAIPNVVNNWLICSLAQRDIAAAKEALAACGKNPILLGTNENVIFPRSFAEGVIARLSHDDDKMRAAFATAHPEQEKIVQAQANYGPALCVLGLIDAGLGRKEQALREGRRAVELVPVEKDALLGPTMIKYLAMIAAWVGDTDFACKQLAMLIRDPSTVSYGQLKLMPFWDPLRGDRRFEKLLEEAKLPLAPSALESGARSAAKVAPAPEKSIAVLPFENRSSDPDNAYLADGIQDEILTRLSKIADLKVISRTSTQHYKSAPTNLPQIAKELGVACVLEGSVQKAGDAVRVNVQLIKAADDSHLWADTFDHKLTDIFSVESDVAKAIAEQLQAKLTGPEEQVIAAKSTDNPEAYDAYLRGLAYSLKTANTSTNALGAQKYLKEAVRLDPKFAFAWALLSYVESRGYITQFLQPTVALRDDAQEAAERALTLQPNLGEAILAKGFYHYACLKDYDTAVRYFEQARPLLPNSSRIPELLAYVTRRQGQWERSESYFNEAERLDPRNVSLLTQHALSCKDRRLFPEAWRKFEQILNITPDDLDTIVEKAVIAQAEGDLPRASALLTPVQPAADDTNALETQAYQAILERRSAPIMSRLKDILAKPDPALGFYKGELRFWLGWTQDVAGDHDAAKESWRQARSELESFLKEQPENHILLGDLALTEMSLGHKAAALTLSERGMTVNPIENDAVTGPASIEFFARVAVQAGEADRAIIALQKLLSTPYSGPLGPGAPLTPALLRLDPMFDPLRNDPRFQKIVDEAKEPAATSVPAKSIAVLPFENLSRDPENGFFTDGVQDEILTDLARIADLKVISRTSVMQYKTEAKRNLRQIGNELGVAHVLEGSVQRVGNRVRVNAQLIDAGTDAHLWAQTYDRNLADVFAIQSEIAKAIADQLQAKLSPSEKSAIEQAPTMDVTAFNLYSHAKNLF
ncbi:MAG TPA: protein kinase [Candidatus Udaeobacter sp.]|nr:protein kinase [Candidatus Udaeobacter sp.]